MKSKAVRGTGFALSLILLLCPLLPAQQRRAGLAEKPPMGWNSWDAYGLTITEAQFRENAQVLAAKLKSFGWEYALIDEGWYLKNPVDRSTPDKLMFELDDEGRDIPVPARFPSALNAAGKNEGFAALASYVHSLGLKFGIHIVRGIPRESVRRNLPVAGSRFRAQDVADTSDACPWDPTNWGVKDTPAGQAWYDSLMAQYVAWGVDYLKVDCISDHPYKSAEIRMLHRAIVKSGRPIVLSLSPGPASAGMVKELQQNAQMWRISDDVWDYWKTSRPFPRTVRDQFDLLATWVPFAHAGSWPDADMLPFGYLGPVPGEGTARETRLTHDEQQTMLTLWSIARSPLVLGANLTKMDAWLEQLLTNRGILELDQNGHDQRQVERQADMVTWISEGKPGVTYLAFFNLGDTPAHEQQRFDFFGLAPGAYRGTELWSHAAIAASTAVDVEIAPHGCKVLELQSAK